MCSRASQHSLCFPSSSAVPLRLCHVLLTMSGVCRPLPQLWTPTSHRLEYKGVLSAQYSASSVQHRFSNSYSLQSLHIWVYDVVSFSSTRRRVAVPKVTAIQFYACNSLCSSNCQVWCRLKLTDRNWTRRDVSGLVVCQQGPPPPNPLVVERFQQVISQLFQQVRPHSSTAISCLLRAELPKTQQGRIYP